jgi:hypothetical protein
VPDSKTIEISFNIPGCEEVGLDTDAVHRLFSERTTKMSPKWTKRP